jgi:hypothetical protein
MRQGGGRIFGCIAEFAVSQPRITRQEEKC